MAGSGEHHQDRDTVERERERDDELESKMTACAEKANSKRDREDDTYTGKNRRSTFGSTTKRRKQTAAKASGSTSSSTKKGTSKSGAKVSQNRPHAGPGHRSPTFAAAVTSVEANDSDPDSPASIQDKHDTPLRDSSVMLDDNIPAAPSQRRQRADTFDVLLVDQAFFENASQTWTAQYCREVIAMLQDIADGKERREALSDRIRRWNPEMASRR